MKKIVVAAIVVAGAGTLAYANAPETDEREEGRGMHRELMQKMRGEGFDVADLANVMQERSVAMFDRLDADGDGTVSRDEFTASVATRADRVFARMDRNDDGVVDRDDRRRGGDRRGPGRHHWR